VLSEKIYLHILTALITYSIIVYYLVVIQEDMELTSREQDIESVHDSQTLLILVGAQENQWESV
jgi:hypothetical protein